MKEQCRNCKKNATYIADTIFGKWYLCGIHIKKYRNNLCVRDIKKLPLTPLLKTR